MLNLYFKKTRIFRDSECSDHSHLVGWLCPQPFLRVGSAPATTTKIL